MPTDLAIIVTTGQKATGGGRRDDGNDGVNQLNDSRSITAEQSPDVTIENVVQSHFRIGDAVFRLIKCRADSLARVNKLLRKRSS